MLPYRDAVNLLQAQLERERPLLAIPFPLWHLAALLAAPLPGSPLTRDQVFMMSEDNTVGEDVGTFADLGIVPRSLRDSLPACLTTQASDSSSSE